MTLQRLTGFGALLLLSMGLLVGTSFAGSARTARHAALTHCGSFKYGHDGFAPGPSDIRARGVSCGFARSFAYYGPLPGWHCRDVIGITFVCHPNAGGRRMVEFVAE